MQNSLEKFFNPKSVAIIGASSNPEKLSHGIMKNLCQYGYKGDIFAINPKVDEILGKKSYASILDVPIQIDLAVIILPAAYITEVLEDCGKKGIGNVIIISGGFKEIGAEGKKREEELLKIAKKYSIRIIGPNCVGNVNLSNGLNTTFIKGLPIKGGIGFVSQSGAVCGGVVDHVIGESVGFSHLISLGNEMDVTETDIIEYLAEDTNTNVICAYVESIRDGKRFLDIAHKTSKTKPIVLLKAGQSELGAKAVSSHTGSIAGSQNAYTAAFKQAGVIEVNSLRDLLNTAMALSFQPLPKDNKAVIITNAGGPAALMSDSLDNNGFKLAEFDQSIQERIMRNLNPAAQPMNPIDMLGGANENEYAHSIKSVIDESNVDCLIPILVPQSLVDPVRISEAIIDQTKDSKKTVLTCFVGKESIQSAKKVLHENKIPLFEYPEDIGKVLAGMYSYSKFLNRSYKKEAEISITQSEKISEFFKAHIGQIHFGEADTRKVLTFSGVDNVDGQFAKNEEEALKIADKFGFPVALKIVSEDILHKSDAGGIRLNIKDGESLKDAFYSIMTAVKKVNPQARIEGVLVEKMLSNGEDVIIGMKRDPNFGPMLMFGMGGIYVEAFKDVSFRIAPVSTNEINEMIEETAAGKILNGLRGIKYDTKAVIKSILAISDLSLAFPQIQELEINPLRVMETGNGAIALDSRMILSGD